MNTWDDELQHFTHYQRAAGQAVTTIKLRRYYLGRFSASAGPDPWAVTADELVAFVATPGWSPETRKSARTSVRSFYGWGAHVGRLLASPADLLPTVRIPRALPHPTPEQTLNRALAVANDRDRLMLMFGAYAGLRRAEIAGLRWTEVAGGVIRIRGKGGRERVVPMHPRLVPALAYELEHRRRGAFTTGHRYGEPGTPYLFPGQSGGSITPGAVGKILTRMIDMPGHSLRHRFATRAYAGTRDLRAVQELLGHTRPETTAIYTQVPDDALRAAVDAA